MRVVENSLGQEARHLLTGRIIIVGAGMAGFTVASSLREGGYAGSILMIGDETSHPYNRPPLSKAFLTGAVAETGIALRPPAYYAAKRIEVLTGRRVVAVDRAHHNAALDDDTVYDYDHLVFAVGARNRELPVPGMDLDGVFYLRTLGDAVALKAHLGTARRIVVVGAGFIGLEFALVACKLGLDVTVVDIANRPMARVLSPQMSAVFVREHEKSGIRFKLETQIMRIVGEGGRVVAVEPVDGDNIQADLVVIGIGVVANTEIAAASNLEIRDGIVVDEYLLTSDPSISAVGDCASHPNEYAEGRRLRLESVQNANDQARCVASRLLGKPAPYTDVPWFWSDQGELKLQMAGITAGSDRMVVRGDTEGTKVSVFCFMGERFTGVETINNPVDHMIGRKVLSNRVPLTPEQAAGPGFDLKALVATKSTSA